MPLRRRTLRSGEEYESEPEHSDTAKLDDDNTAEDTRETLKQAKLDDEDWKNPAFIPRKGIFYEHDWRLYPETERGDIPREGKRSKGKLWTDETSWVHDKFDIDEQAPKSRQELIASYGYDITQCDQPPDVPPIRSGRPRYNGGNVKHQFQDFLSQTSNKSSYSGSRKEWYSSEGYKNEPHVSKSDPSWYRSMNGTMHGRGNNSNLRANSGPHFRVADQLSDSRMQRNRGYLDESFYNMNNNSLKNGNFTDDPKNGLINKYEIKGENKENMGQNNESKTRDNYGQRDLNIYDNQDDNNKENNDNSSNRVQVNLEVATRFKFGNEYASKLALQENISVKSEINDQVDNSRGIDKGNFNDLRGFNRAENVDNLAKSGDNSRDQSGSDRRIFKDRRGFNWTENVDNLAKSAGVGMPTQGSNTPGCSEKLKLYSQRQGSGAFLGKQSESKEVPSEPPSFRLKTDNCITDCSYSRPTPKSYDMLSASDDEKLLGDMDEDNDQIVPVNAMQDFGFTVTGDRKSFNKDSKGNWLRAPQRSQDITSSARQSLAQERWEPIHSWVKHKSEIASAHALIMKHRPRFPPHLQQQQQQQQQQELKHMKQQLQQEQPLVIDKLKSSQHRSNKRYSSQRQKSVLESHAFANLQISPPQPMQLITSLIPQQFQANFSLPRNLGNSEIRLKLPTILPQGPAGQPMTQSSTIRITINPPRAMFISHAKQQIPLLPALMPGPQALMGAPPVFVSGTLASTVIPQVSVLGAPPQMSVLRAPPPSITPAGMIYAAHPRGYQVPVPQVTPASPQLLVQPGETVQGGTAHFVHGASVSATPSTMQIAKQQCHVEVRWPSVLLQIVSCEDLKRRQDSETDDKQKSVVNKSHIKTVQQTTDNTEDTKVLSYEGANSETYVNESVNGTDAELSVSENACNVEEDSIDVVVNMGKDDSETGASVQYKSEFSEKSKRWH